MKVLKWILGGLVGILLLLFIVLYFLSDGMSGIVENRTEIEIEKPANQVFTWISESEKLKQWMHGLKEDIPINGDSLRVGSKSKIIVEDEQGRFEMIVEITQLKMNELLAVHITSEGFEVNAVYKLSESGDVTTLNYEGRAHFKSLFLRLITFVIKPASQQQLENNFNKLKSLVEAEQWETTIEEE